MHAHLHVIQGRHIRKQADILEGTGNAQLVDLMGGHALGIDAVDQNGAAGGLVHRGQQVEDGGLACAVGADEAGNLGGSNGNVESIHRRQAAKVNAQIPDIQNRQLILILFPQQGVGGNLQHLSGILIHWSPPPFS